LRKGEVKFTLEQAMTAQMEKYDYSFLNLGPNGGRWSVPHLGRFTPGKETRLTIV